MEALDRRFVDVYGMFMMLFVNVCKQVDDSGKIGMRDPSLLYKLFQGSLDHRVA